MNKDFRTPYEAYDVSSFCLAHNISRALLYKLLGRGLGPRIMKAGRKTLISKEAAGEWKALMEQKTQDRGSA
jgi:hypothetical protein